MSTADMGTAFDTLEGELKRLNRTTLALLRSEHIKMLGDEPIKTVWFDNQECKFFIPDALIDRIQGLLLETGLFFEHSILGQVREYITPGSTVVDVGANIGNHSMFFALICGAAKVHSFEPQTRLTRIIERNKSLNGLGDDRVLVHNHGCGAVTGRLKIIHQNPGNLGAAQFEYAESGGFEVRRLDDCKIGKADFMKIDAERMGDEVLKGASSLLKDSPKIWIELYEGEDKRAIAVLEQHGYSDFKKLTKYDYLFSKTPL